MRHPAQLLNVNHFRQRCMKAQPDTPIPPYYSTRQIAFVLFTRSGAPGGTRTPDLLVRSHMPTLSKTCRSERKPEECQRVMTILAQLLAPSFITDNQQLVTILHN